MADSECGSARKSRRHPLRILVDYLHDGQIHCEYATDLSEGGLFVETETPLPPGTALKLRFKLPGSDHMHEIEGEVTWRREPELDGVRAPGMGVRFDETLDAATLTRELEKLPRDPA